jgi:hypothetical protein
MMYNKLCMRKSGGYKNEHNMIFAPERHEKE